MKKSQKLLQYLLNVLPHINIVLAVTLLTFFVVDRYNRAMSFIDNDITKWMLCVFCGTVLVEAIATVIYRRMIAKERNAAIDTKGKQGQNDPDQWN